MNIMHGTKEVINPGTKNERIELFSDFESLKEKYFNQAQRSVGVIAGIPKVLNEYVRKYDAANRVRSEELKRIKVTYVYDSSPFEQEHMNIFNTFNDTVAKAKEEAYVEIAAVVESVKNKISAIISKVPDGAMTDISVINSMAGKLSDTEMQVFLEKYKDCYFVVKTLMLSMEEGQRERMGIKFINVDDVMESLENIESLANSLVRTYHGNIPYDFAMMLSGEHTKLINNAFESFVSYYGDIPL